MFITTLLTTILIFFNNLGYVIYEFQNKNNFAGIYTLLLNIFMMIFVNCAIYNFK